MRQCLHTFRRDTEAPPEKNKHRPSSESSENQVVRIRCQCQVINAIDQRMSATVKNGDRWRLSPFTSTSAMTAEVSILQWMLRHSSCSVIKEISSQLCFPHLLHRVPCSSFLTSTWRLTHRPNETHSITMGCYRLFNRIPILLVRSMILHLHRGQFRPYSWQSR